MPALHAAVAALALAARPAPDTVSLRFAWPEGLAATVEFHGTRARTGRPETTASLRGRLVTERRGAEVRVRLGDWTGAGAGDPMLVGAGRVWTVLSPEGDFVRVEETEAALAAIREVFRTFREGAPEGAAGARQFLDQIEERMPALLAQGAKETWSLLVGFWSGGELELGKDYATEETVPVPVKPGATVRLTSTIRAVRRLPCPGGGSCVELRLRTVPNPEDVERLLNELVAPLAADLPDRAKAEVALQNVSGTTEVVLVTDPARLVPYRMEKRRTFRMTAGAGPERGKEGTRSDVDVYTFSYGPAPAQAARPAARAAAAEPPSAAEVASARSGCDRGHAVSCAMLGTLYASGQGVPKDAARAERHLRFACDAEEGLGCRGLGHLHELARDYARAAPEFAKGCELGEAAACRPGADLYLAGRGVPKDSERALALLERGCERDDPQACYRLGTVLSDEKDVEKDLERAADPLRIACEQGVQKGCVRYGTMLALGQAVPADPAAGAELVRKACERGEADGCMILGLLHQRGLGVPRDLGRARALLDRACKGGSAAGCRSLEKLPAP